MYSSLKSQMKKSRMIFINSSDVILYLKSVILTVILSGYHHQRATDTNACGDFTSHIKGIDDAFILRNYR